jgi:putative long chain acyl-CoA synthase
VLVGSVVLYLGVDAAAATRNKGGVSLLRSRAHRLTSGASNMLELVRLGRLSPRRDAPYDVIHQERCYRLRRYVGRTDREAPALVLVPPLMLTAEIYDVAPELSAVATLTAAGIDTYVVDFGAPEREEGGMSRTLDDHVRAVADAVERVRARVGRDVHLAGYSQGGMFAYQAAAYTRSEGLASLITFGSPVDIHRNLPRVSTDVTARVVRGLEPLLTPVARRIEGLPGALTSVGFKLVSVRKEAAQLIDFVQKLHDRQALEKQESRRRFLGGEGFVAWPGPALRTFLDEFIVHNRLVSGGFVIDGRSVTLADIRCPILYFVGARDDLARPAAVRAIRTAAPNAETSEVLLAAGHFGLVVGGVANRSSWPTVIEWLRHREHQGPLPRLLTPAAPPSLDDEDLENAQLEGALDVDLFYGALTGSVRGAWERLGEAFVDAGDAASALRRQLPRLRRLRRMTDETPVSLGRALAERADKTPSATFFLWKGRAFSYAEADRRVDHVVRGLYASGVRAGDSVGVLMDGRPSHLTMVAALSRLGAAAVLLSPKLGESELSRALGAVPLAFVAADPSNASRARAAFAGPVLVLGGGARRRVIDGVVDMEGIDPSAVRMPLDFAPNPGRAGDLAMVFVSIMEGGEPRAAQITNRRWALSAIGAAAACTLTSADTVYCCLPLHHPAGLLVSVGSALASGARLALATRFEPAVFWSEVRTYGVTVSFYAGEMLRALVDAPPAAAEQQSPLRLFAGSGLRADVWRRVGQRFGTPVLEFYAATERPVVLANAAGEKVGSLGRPLPGSADVAIAAWDFSAGAPLRDASGLGRAAAANEPGILVVRASSRALMTRADPQLARDVFERGDAWKLTRDLVRRDEDSDCWYVDRLSDVVRAAGGPIFSRAIEDELYADPSIALAVVVGARLPGEAAEVPVAAVVLHPGSTLDEAALRARIAARLGAASSPRLVRVMDTIAMNEGYRPLKQAVRRGFAT